MSWGVLRSNVIEWLRASVGGRRCDDLDLKYACRVPRRREARRIPPTHIAPNVSDHVMVRGESDAPCGPSSSTAVGAMAAPRRELSSSPMAPAHLVVLLADSGKVSVPRGLHAKMRLVILGCAAVMPRDKGVQSRMHVDGDDDEGETPLVGPTQRTEQHADHLHRLPPRPEPHHPRGGRCRVRRKLCHVNYS